MAARESAQIACYAERSPAFHAEQERATARGGRAANRLRHVET